MTYTESEGALPPPTLTGATSSPDISNIMARAFSGWGGMSRSERMAAFGDMAFEILCGQIERDYTTFFKRHVLSRLDRDARPSVKESNVLIALWSMSKPLTGSEICQSLRARPSTVSRSLSALMDRGWIETAPCDHDSRATCNALTEAGRVVADSIMNYWSLAVEKAEMLTGNRVDQSQFARWKADIHQVKDRAYAYREFKPGRLNVYRQGMSRPDPAYRHNARKAYGLRDSYLRFFALSAQRDYLDCLRARAIKPAISGQGLTLRELRVLMCADFFQILMSQAEIAAIMRMDTATVARATQTLAATGHIRLHEDESDERLCLVSLSKKGQTLAENYRARCLTLAERIEAQYDMRTPKDDIRRLMKTLADIRDRAAAFADLKELPKADPVRSVAA